MNMGSANKSECSCLSIDSHCFPEEFAKQFSSFYVLLEDLLVREGSPRKLPECGRNIKVIDVDKWEIEKARKERRCLHSTMDFASLLDNKKILLVDAKFRVETNELNSKFMQDVKAKLAYSKPLFYVYAPVHGDVILLFQTMKVEQCRNRIRRLMNNKSEFEVMDVFQFYRNYIEKAANN